MNSTLATRPKRTYKTSAATRWIRRAALIIMAAATLMTIVRYPSLPDQIPTHFNIAGQADDWGGRWSVLVLAAIGVALIAGLAWLSFYPHVFNYPREITEQNAQAVYRAGEALVVWLALACSVLFTGILTLVLFSGNRWIIENGGAVGIYGAIGVFAIVGIGTVRIMRA